MKCLLEGPSQSVGVKLTDHLTLYSPIWRDEQGGRKAEQGVGGGNGSGVIGCDRVGDVNLVEECSCGARSVVRVDSQEPHLFMRSQKGSLQQWHLGSAWGAPRGPEVDDQRSPSEADQ